jgi:hypothetical protein
VEIPKKLSDKIKPLISKAEELLRHFWTCIPRPGQRIDQESKFFKLGKQIEALYVNTLEKQKKLGENEDRRALSMMLHNTASSLGVATQEYRKFVKV